MDSIYVFHDKPDLVKVGYLYSSTSSASPVPEPSMSKHKQVTNELIILAFEMINSGCKEKSPESKYLLLNKYLKNFSLKKVECFITWEWNHNASFIGLTETELIDAIKQKIKNFANYKAKEVDEIWLLVISGFRLSQTMSIRLSYELNTFDEVNSLLRQSEYNKVYIYHYMFDVIYEWPGWLKIGKENLFKTIIS